MAQTQTKKKTSSSAKGRQKTAAAAKKSSSGTAPPAKKPIRREVTGIVFLVLALFSGVGYVQTDAIFIHLFANVLKGLFGYGFWVIPPAFLLTGLILLLHHGRPVRLRVTCMLLVPVTVGALLQIVLCREEFEPAFGAVAQLYQTGVAMASGGVVCGGIGYGFERLFGVIASVVVCALVAFACALFALQINPKTVYETSRSRRIEYEPEPEDETRGRGIVIKETTRRRLIFPWMMSRRILCAAGLLPCRKSRPSARAFSTAAPMCRSPMKY